MYERKATKCKLLREVKLSSRRGTAIQLEPTRGIETWKEKKQGTISGGEGGVEGCGVQPGDGYDRSLSRSISESKRL